MTPACIATKSSNFLHNTTILITVLFSITAIRAEEPITPVTKTEIDLTRENAALDEFWDKEFAGLEPEQLIKKLEENPVIADKLAELTLLSCEVCRCVADDGTVTEQLRFCQLSKDKQEKAKKQWIADLLAAVKREIIAQDLQNLIDGTTRPEEKKPSQPTSGWYGLTAADLIHLIPVCYISGRQVRDAGVPGFDEIVSLTGPFKIAGDIALGYCSNMIATICHEAGHSIAYRALYGKWPEKFTIGTNNSNDKALLSLKNGAIALRGLDPLAGVTTLDTSISFKEARSIPFLAAGGICGIAGYYGFKRLVHQIIHKRLRSCKEHGDELSNFWATQENRILTCLGFDGNADEKTLTLRIQQNPQLAFTILPLAVDVAVWYELKNVLLNYEHQGSDAHGISVATGHQFDKLWNKIVAKFKHKKSKDDKKS